MNEFDKASRYGARNLQPERWLRWLCPRAVTQWQFTGWVDSQAVPFPGEPDRRCDLVAGFRHRQGLRPPLALVVEMMSEPSADILERLLEYLCIFRRTVVFQHQPTVQYDVVGKIVYLTGRKQPQRFTMAAKEFQAGIKGWNKPCYMSQLEAQTLLAEIVAGTTPSCLLAWLPLLRGAHKQDVLTQWKQLVTQEPDERLRGDYVGLAKVFAELVERPIWRQQLEGFNVKRSQVIEEWRQEGEVRGEAKGAAAMQRTLRQYLDKQFNGNVSADLAAQIAAQGDLSILEQWFQAALQAQSVEEVRQALQNKP